MANFRIGQVVVNLGRTAKVVGLFAAADGKPSIYDGHPILRELGRDNRLEGGKWLADPDKCEAR